MAILDQLWLQQLHRRLTAYSEEQQRVLAVSHRSSGTTSYLRFLASMATEYVQVHVQHTGTGGGGATYDPATFVSSTEVDCRSNRMQDRTITRDGVNRYYVWLIPVSRLTGSAVKYDGQSGRPDYMTFVDLTGPELEDLTVSGSITLSSGTGAIHANTSPGSDNGYTALAGGGAIGTTRGAYVRAFGNEHAVDPGKLELAAGSAGSVQVTGSLSVSSSATVAGLVETANQFRVNALGVDLRFRSDGTYGYVGTETNHDVRFIRQGAVYGTIGSGGAWSIAGPLAVGSYLEGVEIADPGAPTANSGRLYFRDNGAGKTQLVVRFPTGAVQVLATEP